MNGDTVALTAAQAAPVHTGRAASCRPRENDNQREKYKHKKMTQGILCLETGTQLSENLFIKIGQHILSLRVICSVFNS